MAFIRFTVALVGGYEVELPVQVISSIPVVLALAAGPSVIQFEVQNVLQRGVTIESLIADVIVGDATMVDTSMLDTVMTLAGGEIKASSLTVTPNQEIAEGTMFEVEVSGAEA